MKELEETLKQYLSQMVEIKKQGGKPTDLIYLGVEDLVMREGEVFKSQSYPEEYLRERGQKKECYMNAFQMATRHPNLTYVEGYGISSRIPLPIHHAWCVDEEGKVIDPTWDDQEDCLYIGVKLKESFVIRTVLRNEYYGIMDDWGGGFPMLTGKVKKEDWKA